MSRHRPCMMSPHRPCSAPPGEDESHGSDSVTSRLGLVAGILPETVTVMGRGDLLRVIEEARVADFATVLMIGQGSLNQLGADVPHLVPGDVERLKVLWALLEPGTPPREACDRSDHPRPRPRSRG